MNMEFGDTGFIQLKTFVNKALDNGEWHEGFDIAVKRGDLDQYETAELFDAVKIAYPDVHFNVDVLRELIDQHLPASCIEIVWLTGDDGSIIIADSLRVARFLDDSILWVTNRISWDGIALNKIENGEIFGEWYDATRSGFRPLRLSFDNGDLIEGEWV